MYEDKAQNPKSTSISYADAGVDIEAGNQLVENIKPFIKETTRPEVMGGLGNFAALFDLGSLNIQHPVLVSCTDGVGTKVKLANNLNKHDTIGIDLVAMCVNDLLVLGAQPLFFLDYYASGQLDVAMASDVIKGIATGCKMANTALVGGETAEMPGHYQNKDYDLAGFCVGVIDKSDILKTDAIQAGDVMIGIASSGVHSNGYSLVRKILDSKQIALDTPFANTTLGDILLTPTKIYVKALQQLFADKQIHGCAHITGGGLPENLPRILPDALCAEIDLTSWQLPEIFQWLQHQGNVTETEMLRTFNCGVGMVVIVAPEQVDAVITHLQAQGETAWQLGHIKNKTQTDSVVFK